MSFEKKLQSLRKAAGLNQEELAEELGVSRQAVSKWESGTTYPEMDKLILMTRLFKCTLDDLVNDEIKNPSVEGGEKKKQSSVDSLLEFITKSISMFNSMKLSSVIKCFLEIIVLVFMLMIFSSLVYAIIESVISSIFRASYYQIYVFFEGLLLFTLVILDSIITFQFYKIRYLDYYDKLVYQYEVKSFKKDKTDDNVLELKKEDKMEMNSEETSQMKARERIVIRDPNHKPLAFLSIFSKLVIFVYRALLRFITIPFVCLLIALTIFTVIVIYLISYNTIFIGVSIAGLASIVLTVLIIRTLSDDLFPKKYPIKIMTIIFLIFVVLGGIGIGVSIVSLNNIKFELIDTYTKVEKEYPYNDKLYLNFLENEGKHIVFEVNDLLDNILITYNYDNKYESVELVNFLGDENYLLLEHKYLNINPKEQIDEFLNNLKKNLIVGYEGGYITHCEIIASEKHIKQLISNISERESIYVKVTNEMGKKYYHVYSNPLYEESDVVCETNDFYKSCFNVMDDTYSGNIKYEYKNGKLLYDKERFICNKEGRNYRCRDVYEEN